MTEQNAVYRQYLVYRESNEDPARKLGWNDAEAQQRNFKVVLDMLPPLKDLTVHDAGCGHADLLDVINARGGCKEYIGSDFVATTLNKALELHPEAKLLGLDLAVHKLPQVDLTLCFGALAFHKPRKVEEMLHRMWDASKVGIGFISWWNLDKNYVYHEHAAQLQKCIRRFLKQTRGKVTERIGDYGEPMEAAFVVLR